MDTRPTAVSLASNTSSTTCSTGVGESPPSVNTSPVNPTCTKATLPSDITVPPKKKGKTRMELTCSTTGATTGKIKPSNMSKAAVKKKPTPGKETGLTLLPSPMVKQKIGTRPRPKSNTTTTSSTTTCSDVGDVSESDVNSRLNKLETMIKEVLQANLRQDSMTYTEDRQESEVSSVDLDFDVCSDQFIKGTDEMELSQEIPALAAKFAVPNDLSEPIDEEIANSVSYMLNNKLEPKVLEEAAAKYPPPTNCQMLDTPKVNPSVWDNVPTSTKSNDLKLQRIQKSLVRGLNAFMRTLSADDITDPQQDALALLCNANFELNCVRKDFIKPNLNTRYTHLCKPSNPVTKFLFGDDLSKQVKDLKDEQKATAGVMKVQGNRRFLSHPYKGPSRFGNDNRRFRDAGWVSRPKPQSTRSYNYGDYNSNSRPFLGRASYRGQQTPHNPQPMRTKDNPKSNPKQRKQ